MNEGVNASGLLKTIRSQSAVVDQTLNAYAGRSLKDYVKAIRPSGASPLQPREDFINLQEIYIRDRLGQDAADGVTRAMQCPLMNTANHHGIDFFAQSVQGNMLYWECLQANGVEADYLPIHAFSMVPLGNSSYARGLLVYGDTDRLRTLPVYPEKIKSRLVSQTASFNRQQVLNLIGKIKKDSSLPSPGTILEILEKVYLHPAVLGAERYADQVVYANQMLNRLMFPGSRFPTVITIETDRIAARLLIQDLRNPLSLICKILYNRRVLQKLFLLSERESAYVDTCFFLGIDDAGRGYRLQTGPDLVMRGRTIAGQGMEFSAAEPSHLIDLLERDRITPSAFTVAVLLVFARAFTWLGGCFQGNYLPAWQQALASALEEDEENRAWAEAIREQACRGYISGPVYALDRIGEQELCCAGPVEIIKNGGIEYERLQELLEIDLQAAHEAGLFNMYPDFMSRKDFSWWPVLARELYQRLGRYTCRIR